MRLGVNLKSKTRETILITALAIVIASFIFLWRDNLSTVIRPSPALKPEVITTVLDKNKLPQYFSPQFPLPQDAKGVDSRVVQDEEKALIIYNYTTQLNADEALAMYLRYFERDAWNWQLKESAGPDGARILTATPTLETTSPFLITLTLTFGSASGAGRTLVLTTMTIPNISDYSIGTTGPLSIPWNRR